MIEGDSTSAPAPPVDLRDRTPDQRVEVAVTVRTLMKIVGVVLGTLTLLWAANAAREACTSDGSPSR